MRFVTAALTAVLVIVTAIYVKITAGLLSEARTERQARVERELSEQARLVGGYIALTAVGHPPGHAMLHVHLVNSSPLPVRGVHASVHYIERPGVAANFLTSVLNPGEFEDKQTIPEPTSPMRLILDFDDDSGQRWRKYESDTEPLKRLAQPTG